MTRTTTAGVASTVLVAVTTISSVVPGVKGGTGVAALSERGTQMLWMPSFSCRVNWAWDGPPGVTIAPQVAIQTPVSHGWLVLQTAQVWPTAPQATSLVPGAQTPFAQHPLAQAGTHVPGFGSAGGFGGGGDFLGFLGFFGLVGGGFGAWLRCRRLRRRLWLPVVTTLGCKLSAVLGSSHDLGGERPEERRDRADQRQGGQQLQQAAAGAAGSERPRQSIEAFRVHRVRS